jgi:hypothetical protein
MLHNISLTLKFPLLHAQFLAEFMPAIILPINLSIYGENNGYLTE